MTPAEKEAALLREYGERMDRLEAMADRALELVREMQEAADRRSESFTDN